MWGNGVHLSYYLILTTYLGEHSYHPNVTMSKEKFREV